MTATKPALAACSTSDRAERQRRLYHQQQCSQLHDSGYGGAFAHRPWQPTTHICLACTHRCGVYQIAEIPQMYADEALPTQLFMNAVITDL